MSEIEELRAEVRHLRTQLAESESARFAEAVNVGGAGLYKVDLERGRVDLSKRWISLFGYDCNSNLSCKEWLDLLRLSESDRSKLLHAWNGGPNDFVLQYEIRLCGGVRLWIKDRGRVEKVSGIPKFVHGSYTDVTKLKENEDFQNTILNTVPSYVFIKIEQDKTRKNYFRFFYANKALLDAFGLPLEEVVGSTDYDLTKDRHQADRFLEVDRWVVDHHEPRDIKEEKLRVGSKERILVTKKVPIEVIVNGEQKTAVLGVATDVTKLREQVLSEREMRDIVLEHTPVGISIKNENLEYLMVNKELFEFFMEVNPKLPFSTADELVSSQAKIGDIFPDPSVVKDAEEEELAVIRSGIDQPLSKLKRFNINGEPRLRLVTKVQIEKQDGAKLLVSVAKDVTSQEQAQRLTELKRRPLLSILGIYSPHSAKKPFNLIYQAAANLDELISEKDFDWLAASSKLEAIRRNCDDGCNSIDEFQRLIENERSDPEMVVLNSFLSDFSRWREVSLGTDQIVVEDDLAYGQAIVCTAIEKNQLTLLLLCLFENAVSAIQSQRSGIGRIKLTIRYCADSNVCKVLLIDDAGGMPPSTMEKINRLGDEHQIEPVLALPRSNGDGFGYGVVLAHSLLTERIFGKWEFQQTKELGRLGTMVTIEIPGSVSGNSESVI